MHRHKQILLITMFRKNAGGINSILKFIETLTTIYKKNYAIAKDKKDLAFNCFINTLEINKI